MTKANEETESIGLAEWRRSKPSSLWAWWLRKSKPDGSGLRRWQAWIWWTRQRGLSRKLSALLLFLRGIVEAPIEVLGGLRRFGKKTVERYGVSYLTQFWHLLMLRWKFGIRPETYYKFRIFEPGRFENAQNFIEECGQLLQVILSNSPRAADEKIFIDKESFCRWCIRHSLPTVQHFLEANGKIIVSRSFDSLPAVDLFIKPTNWRQGRGVSRWRCISLSNSYYYEDGKGCKFSPVEMEQFVCNVSCEEKRPYLIQPALKNHLAMIGFTSGALATIRLMTVRAVEGKAMPLLAAIRLPTGDSIADNFGLGAVGVPIDLDSGRCGIGVKYDGDYPPDSIEIHPDTGLPINSLTIPWWSECLDLVSRAHDLIEGQVPVIGWDLAVLDEGPLLIEANHLPGGNIAQMPSGNPLGVGAFADIVHQRLTRLFLQG